MIFAIRIVCLLIFCSLCGCSCSQNKQKITNNPDLTFETYIEMNKKRVGEEQKKIEKFIKDKNLSMERTETGLWYNISEEGAGEFITKGRIVTIGYSVRLFDGTLIYSSDKYGTKEFLVGQGGVETGLEEGILMLKKGSKAFFIMPPHLAHGLMGDDNKIPSRAILLYNVEVIDIKNN
ncbi:MAG: FKBP-type peptidyl-prolyl cis-trans isomerase [Marinilabiliaceae bacterium]|nr:FKBP-type peptidyl-prolyl cis-trans isomerase [Marinilabiliaceae bacterium]